MTRNILFALSLGLALPAFSQTGSSKLKPLLFQADKNNIQVLPQRFEYTLLDEDRFKIGDILLDTTQVRFQVEASKENPGSYSVHFQWPASLIKEGQLALKDSSGKAIFSTLLSSTNTQIKTNQSEQNELGLRSEIAHFKTNDFPPDLIEEMKYMPFMKFCIFRETEGTRLYLCSQELYLSSQDSQMIVKARQANQNTASIEINGKSVGDQGIIYLNDRNENIAFKAQTRSGAFLEIETRLKEVDFKDAVLAADNENINLTASGALPVNEAIIKKINDSDWQILLPLSRPLLYLKGDGDIPMRQEFFIRGDLPREKNRAFISGTSLPRTYSSQLSFSGLTANENSVKSDPQSPLSLVQNLKKNTFRWNIKEIPKGKKSSHYLLVTNQNKDFTARYDVFRGEPYILSLETQYQSPGNITFGRVELQWWLENFLNIKAPWTAFHWGTSLERQQQLNETTEISAQHLTTVSLLWRAQDGFPMIDGSWGLSLPVQIQETTSGSEVHFGLGAFGSYKTSKWWTKIMDWYEVKLQVTSLDSRVQGTAFYPFASRWYLRYGLEATQNKDLQMGGHLGVVWKF